jgi:LEA14-like dessication related protein
MALARAAWMALAAGMTLVLAACSKPEPPVLRALDAQVTNLTPAAVELLVRVEAYNPNRFGLTAQSVTSHLVVDGRIDLGTATLPGPIALPAEGRTTVQLPVTLPFRDAGTVALLAATGAPVPYTVDGTARIGGERLNVEVPFRVEGALSQADFVRATLRSLPGLTVPPP